MKDDIHWDVHITLNSIFVALISFPLVGVFVILSYKLITTAFVDPLVREDIESYIAVLGILSGPAYMVISRFFDRWNAEAEQHVEARRIRDKTDNDIKRILAGAKPEESDVVIGSNLENSEDAPDQESDIGTDTADGGSQ